MADSLFFFLQVALGPGEGVALLLHEVVDFVELAEAVGREAALALAALVGLQEVELLLPVADKAGGDTEHGGHFADGIVALREGFRKFTHVVVV